MNTIIGAVWVLNIDKLGFKAFNCLVYNYEVSIPLIAIILLNLPKFYIFYKTIKKVNL